MYITVVGVWIERDVYHCSGCVDRGVWRGMYITVVGVWRGRRDVYHCSGCVDREGCMSL